MTDSVSQSYCSNIRPRLPISSGHSRSHSADRCALVLPHQQLSLSAYRIGIDYLLPICLQNEKTELKKLNETFLSYIERLRLFESFNECLSHQAHHIQQSKQRSSEIYAQYTKEYDDETKSKLEYIQRQTQDNEEKYSNLEKVIDSTKQRHDHLLTERDQNRSIIKELQRKYCDLECQTKLLKFELENVNYDKDNYRKQLSDLEAIRKQLTQRIQQEQEQYLLLKLDVDELELEKEIIVQAHEADTQTAQVQCDNLLYDLINMFRLDSSTSRQTLASKLLGECRDEYRTKDGDMRADFQRRYTQVYNEYVTKQQQGQQLDVTRDEMEKHRLNQELSTLQEKKLEFQDNVHSIKHRIDLLIKILGNEEHRQIATQECQEQEIGKLKEKIKQYELALDTGTGVNNSGQSQLTLDHEVKKYRELLEGTTHQHGLKQIISSAWLKGIIPLHSPVCPRSPTVSVNNLIYHEGSSSQIDLTIPANNSDNINDGQEIIRSRHTSGDSQSYDTAVTATSDTDKKNKSFEQEPFDFANVQENQTLPFTINTSSSNDGQVQQQPFFDIEQINDVKCDAQSAEVPKQSPPVTPVTESPTVSPSTTEGITSAASSNEEQGNFWRRGRGSTSHRGFSASGKRRGK
ncbi:unnamed protein product [Didymodactylos carnosus]|uniref:Uncharacterized protein n=1 Tax=Didymodactylos carnosus TaxID=1234261 RepID=A0A813UHN5_9BILA|nr:unnamed protein product [Didymodactylos carnosus]CAF0826703.1 unnamed protein product [Didymodactylos carnosus]CAF3549625.1 unnamed protein product [Didymodactylos carnosus]CAF3613567.1 unnamed protein product [Didymodactylos carnosus]